jgi:MFS family permease
MAEGEIEVQAAAREFKDRKIRLVVLGIIQILLGCLALLLSAGVFASSMIAVHKNPEFNLKQIILGALLYLVISICLIWLGIGLIMTRRWARALGLILSWVWLLAGTMGFIFGLIMIPSMLKNIQAGTTNTPKGLLAGVIIGVLGFMSIFYVILPGIFVLLLRGRNVKITCENRDAKIRWTDKCPLPVLAVSLLMTVSAISMLFMGIYNWTIPIFGKLITGHAGAAIVLILVLIYAYTAWAIYKLKISGWWVLISLLILMSISMFISFSQINMAEYMDKMGLNSGQYQNMNFKAMLILCGGWSVFMIVYLLYIRKYFKRENNENFLQANEMN